MLESVSKTPQSPGTTPPCLLPASILPIYEQTACRQENSTSVTLQQPKVPQPSKMPPKATCSFGFGTKGVDKVHSTGCSQQSTHEDFFLMSPFGESSKPTFKGAGCWVPTTGSAWALAAPVQRAGYTDTC